MNHSYHNKNLLLEMNDVNGPAETAYSTNRHIQQKHGEKRLVRVPFI